MAGRRRSARARYISNESAEPGSRPLAGILAAARSGLLARVVERAVTREAVANVLTQLVLGVRRRLPGLGTSGCCRSAAVGRALAALAPAASVAGAAFGEVAQQLARERRWLARHPPAPAAQRLLRLPGVGGPGR